MAYFHCSPTAGIHILEPRSPGFFDKPQGVYMATFLPTVLFYGVQNFEYAYGYTRDGRLYYEEYSQTPWKFSTAARPPASTPVPRPLFLPPRFPTRRYLGTRSPWCRSSGSRTCWRP